jgi:hypothetical protein
MAARTAAGATASRYVRVGNDNTVAPIGSSADPIYMAGVAARQLIGPWAQTNIAASQASVQIGLGASGAVQLDAVMMRDGFVTGISASFTVAPAGSTLTLKIYKNGALIDATGILSVTAGASLARRATFVAGLAALGFVAGDVLGIAILTDGSWTATTSDVAVMLEVQT